MLRHIGRSHRGDVDWYSVGGGTIFYVVYVSVGHVFVSAGEQQQPMTR